MRRPVRMSQGAVVAVLALALAGCGGEDFENEPRPAASVQLSARVAEDGVVVSPSEVGAGLVEVTISNQTDSEVRLAFDGPTDTATAPIGGGSVLDFKTRLEPGTYEVDAGAGARAARLRVGAERPSSQNELLLP